MDLSIYQLVLAGIAIFFVASGIFNFVSRKSSQTFFKFFVTMFVWGGVLFFSLFPSITHTISSKFGAGENLNTLIFIGFVVVFIIIFKLLTIIEKQERSITQIIRERTLEGIDEHCDN